MLTACVRLIFTGSETAGGYQVSELKTLAKLVNEALAENLGTIAEKASKAGRIKFLTGDDENASATFFFAIEDDDDPSLYFEVRISSDIYQYSEEDEGAFNMQRNFFSNQANAAIESLPDELQSKVNSSFEDIYVSIYLNDQMI